MYLKMKEDSVFENEGRGRRNPVGVEEGAFENDRKGQRDPMGVEGGVFVNERRGRGCCANDNNQKRNL